MNDNKSATVRNTVVLLLISVVLVLVSCFVPLLSTVGMIACGLPVACIAAQNKNKITVVSLLVIFLLLFLITHDAVAAVSFCLLTVVPGAVAGRNAGKKTNFFTTLLFTCITVCVGWLVMIASINGLTQGQGFETILNDITQEMPAVPRDFLPQGVTPEDAVKMIEEVAEMMKSILTLYFPSIVVLSSLFMGYIIVRISGWLIRKLKFGDPCTVPFSMLKAPRSMSFAAVILYLVSMVGNGKGTFGAVSANVVMVLYTIIGICGLSLIDSKLKKKISGGIFRFILYLIVFVAGAGLGNLITGILVITGIVDSSHNFRRILSCGDSYGSGNGGE